VTVVAEPTVLAACVPHSTEDSTAIGRTEDLSLHFLFPSLPHCVIQ
jgi:hypothetical protein